MEIRQSKLLREDTGREVAVVVETGNITSLRDTGKAGKGLFREIRDSGVLVDTGRVNVLSLEHPGSIVALVLLLGAWLSITLDVACSITASPELAGDA